jgi:hypothetical protein
MKKLVVMLMALGFLGLASENAQAGGGTVPRVMFYPYYYPPYAYSSFGPYYSHVYPYYATYYYPFYAPYYPNYPTIYAGPGDAMQVFTPTVQYHPFPTPIQAGPFGY